MTLIARVSDGLALAASTDDDQCVHECGERCPTALTPMCLTE